MPRAISTIAYEIRREWKKPYFGAVPYLEAMCSLDSINDNYGMDSARSVVNYFLANAATFRGPRAQALKIELRAMLNNK